MFNAIAFAYAAIACLLIALLWASITVASDYKGWKRIAGIAGAMLAFCISMAIAIPDVQPDQCAEQGGQEAQRENEVASA